MRTAEVCPYFAHPPYILRYLMCGGVEVGPGYGILQIPASRYRSSLMPPVGPVSVSISPIDIHLAFSPDLLHYLDCDGTVILSPDTLLRYMIGTPSLVEVIDVEVTSKDYL